MALISSRCRYQQNPPSSGGDRFGGGKGKPLVRGGVPRPGVGPGRLSWSGRLGSSVSVARMSFKKMRWESVALEQSLRCSAGWVLPWGPAVRGRGAESKDWVYVFPVHPTVQVSPSTRRPFVTPVRARSHRVRTQAASERPAAGPDSKSPRQFGPRHQPLMPLDGRTSDFHAPCEQSHRAPDPEKTEIRKTEN